PLFARLLKSNEHSRLQLPCRERQLQVAICQRCAAFAAFRQFTYFVTPAIHCVARRWFPKSVWSIGIFRRVQAADSADRKLSTRFRKALFPRGVAIRTQLATQRADADAQRLGRFRPMTAKFLQRRFNQLPFDLFQSPTAEDFCCDFARVGVINDLWLDAAPQP